MPNDTAVADPPVCTVAKIFPPLLMLTCVALPTCRSAMSDPAALAVFVKLAKMPLNVVPLAFHVCVRLSAGKDATCVAPVSVSPDDPTASVIVTGPVRAGLVIVCTPVNVLAASVRATVALVVGNV